MLGNLCIDLYLDDNDLPPVPALEGDEEVKFEPEETFPERIKLNPRKTKKIQEQDQNFNSKHKWKLETIHMN